MIAKTLLGVLAVIAFFILSVIIFNASFWVPASQSDGPFLIAHRGVHQGFSREGLTNETCTAAQSIFSDHDFIENTEPSMRAAFERGAEVVEIDIHLTRDGQFAVFHDWTLDCRTDGTGETRSRTMDELRQLDLGYGYTQDGTSYPLRGQGVGLMMTLDEVFETFPEKSFLVEVKGGEPEAGQALLGYLDANPQRLEQIWGVYGARRPVGMVEEAYPETLTFHARQTRQCLMGYIKTGWTGQVPEPCHDTAVYVPVNYAPLMWGWPNRFIQRMDSVGSTVVLIGPYQRGDIGTRGFDEVERMQNLPDGLPVYIQTDKIEVLGPALNNHE